MVTVKNSQNTERLPLLRGASAASLPSTALSLPLYRWDVLRYPVIELPSLPNSTHIEWVFVSLDLPQNHPNPITSLFKHPFTEMHHCSHGVCSPLLQQGINPTCSTTGMFPVVSGWRALIASYTRLSLGLEKENVRTFNYNMKITQQILNIVWKHGFLLSSFPLWDGHMTNKVHEGVTIR